MTRSEIVTDLTEIFHHVFDDDSIVLSDRMTADDVAKWDSLHHMKLIAVIEASFGIKFRTIEIEAPTTVGDLVNAFSTGCLEEAVSPGVSGGSRRPGRPPASAHADELGARPEDVGRQQAACVGRPARGDTAGQCGGAVARHGGDREPECGAPQCDP